MSNKHQHLDALITALAAFSGILTETMVRGQSVALIGRRLERALGEGHAPGRPFRRTRGPPGSRPRCGPRRALITYRRRYQPVPNLAGALRLLITDLAHPCALPFQSGVPAGPPGVPAETTWSRPVQSNEAYSALPAPLHPLWQAEPSIHAKAPPHPERPLPEA